MHPSMPTEIKCDESRDARIYDPKASPTHINKHALLLSQRNEMIIINNNLHRRILLNYVF